MSLNKQFFSKVLNKEIPFEELKQQYLNGKSLRVISEEYGVNRGTLSKYLKQDNITIKGNNPGQERRYEYNCNENFFEVIDSQEKAYILGFFLADGSFTANGIKFDQTQSNKIVLEYIKKTMGADQEIKIYEGRIINDPYNVGRTYISQPMCRLNLSRIKLKNDLQALGVQENKTYNFNNLHVPSIFWNDFMRGFLDGDGSVNMSQNSFYISYTIKNIDLANYIVENSKPFYNFNIKYEKRSNSYTLYISNYENAKKYYECVYHKDCCFKLEYKFQTLNKILGN